ncbi:sigma-70 family RNA polymerase sigma factor [Stutzerimonas kirkiae]|uniref:sigma-70 family RNA polymerase sigma factor n=1 Tax=Stutzerimonas kirkiae TaxID=2211392 RepID=UPI0010385D77|nr:sigma-70 family RNA polymerase sigma factor [Stutzerimonas kirkiae]TBV10464.1 RNA polymerase subunit sigma [Stutzerimonas kirkiae]
MPPADIDQLYREHHAWLHTWLRRRLDCTADASDLSHDVFMRLLKKQHDLEIRGSQAFLLTIAKGILANFHRHRHIERAYQEALAQLPEQQAPSPELHALLFESLLAVDRTLGELPFIVRKAFLLSQLDGMKQADIAMELGISVATVKRHIIRALQRCCLTDD